jgi:hypothetical protein
MVKRPQPSKPKVLPREVPWEDDETDPVPKQAPPVEPTPSPPEHPPPGLDPGVTTDVPSHPPRVEPGGRPPVFRAPMGDERKRYLLTHIGHISSDAHTWSEEVRELADAALVKVSGDMLVLTDAGREELERL